MSVRSIRRKQPREVLGRPYWRAEDAELVLEAWQRSGLSMAAFAREHRVGRARLVRWQRLLKDRLDGARPVAFHPVRVVLSPEGPAEPGTPTTVELVLTGGRRVAVRRGFDTVALEELVRVVESWPC